MRAPNCHPERSEGPGRAVREAHACRPTRAPAPSLTLGMTALLLFAVACHQQSDLPKLFPVPSTNLVNEKGAPVNLASMKGNVAVYDFIFTTCRGTCPIMTNNMRALTKQIGKDAPVRFVSISIDPSRDTPQVLAEYAKRVRNDDRWTFLTGKREDIIKLSVEGFKLTAGDPGPGGDPLLHSSKFAVADKNGVIRGYYDAADGSVTDEVAKAVNELARD